MFCTQAGIVPLFRAAYGANHLFRAGGDAVAGHDLPFLIVVRQKGKCAAFAVAAAGAGVFALSGIGASGFSYHGLDQIMDIIYRQDLRHKGRVTNGADRGLLAGLGTVRRFCNRQLAGDVVGLFHLLRGGVTAISTGKFLDAVRNTGGGSANSTAIIIMIKFFHGSGVLIFAKSAGECFYSHIGAGGYYRHLRGICMFAGLWICKETYGCRKTYYDRCR